MLNDTRTNEIVRRAGGYTVTMYEVRCFAGFSAPDVRRN